jgi:ribosomal protein L37AE/L43A
MLCPGDRMWFAILGPLLAAIRRVHQIVETAGGARRWGRRSRLPVDLACSFCGRPQLKVKRLVAGPGIYICEKCVETAEEVIRSGHAAETALGPLEPAPENITQRRCGFCGKYRNQVTGLATSVGNPVTVGKSGGDASICAECLALCREIHAEQLA